MWDSRLRFGYPQTGNRLTPLCYHRSEGRDCCHARPSGRQIEDAPPCVVHEFCSGPYGSVGRHARLQGLLQGSPRPRRPRDRHRTAQSSSRVSGCRRTTDAFCLHHATIVCLLRPPTRPRESRQAAPCPEGPTDCRRSLPGAHCTCRFCIFLVTQMFAFKPSG
jgi:hypothetical protein